MDEWCYLIGAREEEKKVRKHSSKEKADSTSTVTKASIAGEDMACLEGVTTAVFLVAEGNAEEGEPWNQLSTFALIFSSSYFLSGLLKIVNVV